MTGGNTLRFTVLALITLGLAGCQALASLTGEAPEPTSAVAATEVPDSADTNVAARPAPAEPIDVDDDPDQFLGLSGVSVAERLGDPDLLRRDGPAEVRQYRGEACVLDVFLYPQDDALTVKYVELRGASLEPEARRACLASLIRDRLLTS